MRNAVELGRVEWHRHVLERMAERTITRQDVLKTLLNGERIEDYPHDYPLSSALFLGWVEERPLHVVAAFDPGRTTVAIITAYEPTLDRFEADFQTRRKR